jgi:hypothetical protein
MRRAVHGVGPGEDEDIVVVGWHLSLLPFDLPGEFRGVEEGVENIL